ncbi:MAG: FAD-dependent oxidoreductase [Candidatus Bathyarchaeia archaeon]
MLEEEIPITFDVDVLVAGGGIAGLTAAIASARSGAETLLVERYNFLGGLATGGYVTYLAPPPIPLDKGGYGGIFQEIVERLLSLGAAYQFKENEGGAKAGEIIFDGEMLKYIANHMVMESNVMLLLNTYIEGAIVEEGSIKGLIAINKSGRQILKAKVFVDSTGDGDVAAFAGAPYEKEEVSKMLPITMMYAIGGVDIPRFLVYLKEDPGLAKAAKKANFTTAGKARGPSMISLHRVCKDQVEVWGGSVHADGTDALDLTRAELELRDRIVAELEFLRKNVPGFEVSYIASSSPYIGVRETRRIIGDYILTAEDLRAGRCFEDSVAWYRDPRFPGAKGKSIPYRCLIAKGLKNLLVAGRCFSATHEALDMCRLVNECSIMGQAAGTAAAIAAKGNLGVRDVEISELRKKLAEQGAFVKDPIEI